MIQPYILAASLLIPTWLWAGNAKVELGQSFEQTVEILGKPIGLIELRDKTLLLYPQGEITLRENKISNIDLMSAAQFSADQARLKLEREEWLIQQEKRAAARLKEGEQLKAYKMQSNKFTALPAKDRLDYWRSFQVRFPEVTVDDQISRALESYAVELTELKNQHQIAELEARVAKAEQEAATARLETEKLRKETDSVSNSKIRIRDHYTTPYNYYYRPPKVIIYPGKGHVTHQKRDHSYDCQPNHNILLNQCSGTTSEHVTRSLNTK
jgi:hypothetical protein